MRITIKDFKEQLVKDILKQMNPPPKNLLQEPVSQPKLESPPPLKPAQHLTISAVSNGWTVSADYSERRDVYGCVLPQFVYNTPEEVAGAVFGLIRTGKPDTVQAVDPNANEFTDPWGKTWVPQGSVGPGPSFSAGHEHCIRLLREGKLSCEGFPAFEALKIRVPNLERELKESNLVRSDLCARLEAARCGNNTSARTEFSRGYTAGIEAATKNGSSLVRLANLSGYVKGHSAASAAAKDLAPVELFPEVGDVWRSVSPSGRTCVRGIISVEGQKVSYIATTDVGSKHVVYVRSMSTLCDLLREREKSTVTRNAFSPQLFPHEPVEGFVVGDVWMRPDGGAQRRVISVTKEKIVYDFRTCWTDHEPMHLTNIRENNSYPLDANGATLIRK